MDASGHAMEPVALITRLVNQYREAWAAMNPHQAINAGMHAHDGRVADWSPSRISAYQRLLGTTIDALETALSTPSTPLMIGGTPPWGNPERTAAWDARLVLANARAERFRWAEFRAHQTNPLTYLTTLDVSPYVKRNYAPITERIDALIQHIMQIPVVLATARAHLLEPIPLQVLEQSIAMYEGLARFHGGDLAHIVQRAHEPGRLADFNRANQQAIAAYQDFGRFLRNRIAHASDSNAIGPDLLRGLIAANEGVDLPLAELLAVGIADLERNHARMVAIAGRMGMTPGTAMQVLGRAHPPADHILHYTRRILEDLRRFIVQEGLVSVPGELRCLVQETPPFMRTGSAFMDAPGPLETGPTEAYFYLTLPDPAWSVGMRESWLAKQSIPGLTNTAIHEAWPGHYLQFLHLARAGSLAARLFTCTSFTEGWAHYAEEMMVEAGFHAEDPQYELQQVSMALLRDCRLIVALRIHTEDIAITEAADFIAREAFFSPIRARQEAIRGARDPSYLNYTLGKLLFLRLRDDLRRAYPQWNTAHLHDTLLGCGAPPIPLLREMLLGADQTALFPA